MNPIIQRLRLRSFSFSYSPISLSSLQLRYYDSAPTDVSGVRIEDPEVYDVCVIGCGPAGFAAAMRATDLKKKVCVIEKNKVGGVGLHHGALSSKALWECSDNYRRALMLHCAGPFDKQRKERKFGAPFNVTGVDVDYSKVNSTVWKVIEERQRQMEYQLKYFKIPLIHGEARFVTKNKIDAVDRNGDVITINAKNFVLATGSRPRDDPNIYADGHVIMTSDHIQKNLEDFPKSLAIIGAGVVGCEFATTFGNFGKTKVHIINRSTRVLPFEDIEISKILEEEYIANGVTIHQNSRIKWVREINGEAHILMSCADGKEKTLIVEKALLSIGRVPNTCIPGLTKIGVQFNDRGAIVEHETQTSVPNIYAVGDITADVALVNMAEIEARFAINKMFGIPQGPLSYEDIAKIMFVYPMTAGIGMNEQEAAAAKIPHRVSFFKYDLCSRAMVMGEPNGFIKLICSNEHENSKVLGARAMGPHAASLIGIVALMIKMGTPISELAPSLKSAYPSILEGLQECARIMDKSSIWKPEAFPDSISYKEVNF